jgi:branched-chain amino acid transport system ATP-binding protein
MGAYLRKKKADIRPEIAMVCDRFPILAARNKQYAGNLSGGEQRMLAIGMALMAKPKLLMLDEPSLGLAPLIVAEMFKIIANPQPLVEYPDRFSCNLTNSGFSYF